MKFIELKTTFDNIENAKELSEFLLDEKLVACAQIFKIESHYIWKNERFIKDEYMMLAKTRKSLFPRLEKTVKSKHNYEVCELISTPITNITKEYANWIIENTENR